MAECLSPFKKDGYNLPCGKCYECKARRVSGWSFRLMKEAERSCSAFFVTLTYNTDNVPLTKNGFMSLDKTDLQKYFKRLRKKDATKIKYYACGEYGGRTLRPHYHIILFNSNINDIQTSWGLGEIHIGEVSPASVGYTLKYINKSTRIPIHSNDDRIKEFSLMSKKMGDNYINEKTKKWHKNDLENRMYIPLKDGKKIAMPRYYKEKIYTSYQRKKISNAVINSKLQEYQQLTPENRLLKMEKENQIAIAKGKKNTERNTKI